MTPPRRLAAYTAPDCPAWVDDPSLAFTRRQLAEWAEMDRATRRAEGRLAEATEAAGPPKPAKRRKKDPHPYQISLIDSATGDSSDGKYDA